MKKSLYCSNQKNDLKIKAIMIKFYSKRKYAVSSCQSYTTPIIFFAGIIITSEKNISPRQKSVITLSH